MSILVPFLLFAACGEVADSTPGSSDAVVDESRSPCAPARSTPPPPGIELTLDVRPDEAGVNTLTLAVRNDGDDAVRNYRGSQAADFWIETPEGDVVWLWSEHLRAQGSVFTEELRTETFAPGRSRTDEAVWHGETCDDPTQGAASPGEYIARGLWKSSPRSGGGADAGSWWSPPARIVFR